MGEDGGGDGSMAKIMGGMVYFVGKKQGREGVILRGPRDVTRITHTVQYSACVRAIIIMSLHG